MDQTWHRCMDRRRNHPRQCLAIGLGGVDCAGVKICPFPLTRPVAVNTGLAAVDSVTSKSRGSVSAVVALRWANGRLMQRRVPRTCRQRLTHVRTHARSVTAPGAESLNQLHRPSDATGFAASNCHSCSSRRSSDVIRFHANRFVNSVLCVKTSPQT